MIVIPRQVCRETNSALAHEWIVKNDCGGYAAASVAGALTRRQHGLLVATLEPSRKRHVLLAKLDEEVEVEGHVYKLGTNEYQGNVISPDGFLYLQEMTIEGALATFRYEAAGFELTKMIWMEKNRDTTFIHYQLGGGSAPVQLTLVPLCDYRASDAVTHGSENWHFKIEMLANGFSVKAHDAAASYRILSTAAVAFTPLDLWYWRFQLRADENVVTDLYVPGLLRAALVPGGSCTVIATTDESVTPDIDVPDAINNARARAQAPALPDLDKFSSEIFS